MTDIWNHLIITFSAGLLSSITPRALPLVFILGAYASWVWSLKGLSDDPDESIRSIFLQVLFTAGSFFTATLLLGLPATEIGEYIIRIQPGLRLSAGAVMIATGLSHLLYGKIRLSTKANTVSRRPFTQLTPISLILGTGMAVWWNPGAGMVLTTITIYAATIEGRIRGSMLIAAYQAGFTLIYLMVGLTAWSILGAWLVDARPILFWVRLAGAVMVLLGLALFLNQLHWLAPQGRAAFVV